MKKKITKYVSSNAFKTKELRILIDEANNFNYNIEFSGGLNYSKNFLKLLSKLKNKKCFHNYFPIPKKSFALNLGSKNKEVLDLSINHCKKAIRISNEQNLKYFSFHTPFCVDPGHLRLSKGFPTINIQDYNETIDIFKNSLLKLISYNKTFNSKLKLLIENNVCSNIHNTPLKIKKKLFTFTDSNDYIDLLGESFFKSNIYILLDFAHLQVSSSVLKFDKNKHLKKISKYIIGAHLSLAKNNIDNNQKINSNSWFLKYLKKLKNLEYISLEVFNINRSEINQQINLINKWT